MATLNNILTYARTMGKTDSNGMTDANGIIFANEALSDFHRRLISRGVDASQVQESYRDGAAGVGTYLYPSDMFFLKSIELNYADTNAQNYKRAEQVDVSNLEGNVSVGWLRTNQPHSSPAFDDRGDWFEIFPTPLSTDSVSQMIRIFYFLAPTDYAATTDTVNYPENLDYRILGWRIAASYLYSIGSTVGTGRNAHLRGDKFIEMYEQHIEQLITTLSKGTQQPTQAKRLAVDGFEF